MSSNIGWTDEVWNPVSGCTLLSPGCLNCYAARLTGTRLKDHPRCTGLAKKTVSGRYQFTGEVRLHYDLLEQPLHWRKPRRIFVCSMSDLFHEQVVGSFLRELWNVMKNCPQHQFQILTKRPERFLHNLRHWIFWADYQPLANVWLGVSCENQRYAEERIPLLQRCPAAIRFVSFEPLLGAIDIGELLADVDWAIIGGESGPGYRECPIEWITDLARQCKAAGIATFVKQDCGAKPGKQGRIPDNIWAWKEYPRGIKGGAAGGTTQGNAEELDKRNA